MTSKLSISSRERIEPLDIHPTLSHLLLCLSFVTLGDIPQMESLLVGQSEKNAHLGHPWNESFMKGYHLKDIYLRSFGFQNHLTWLFHWLASNSREMWFECDLKTYVRLRSVELLVHFCERHECKLYLREKYGELSSWSMSCAFLCTVYGSIMGR